MCYINKNYGFVIDGSTGITKEHYTNAGTDALWFAKKVAKYLKKHLKDLTKSIEQVLVDCLKSVNKEYDSFLKGRLVIDKPCCCVAVFRVENDKVVFYELGDCLTLIKLKNGEVQKIVRQDHINLDLKSHHAVLEYKNNHENVSYIEAKKLYKMLF